MADPNIAGLFITPEQYQQQQQNALFNQAQQFGNMAPDAAARAMLYSGGRNLLSAEDPMLQQLSAVQDVMKQANPNDPRAAEIKRRLGVQ